MEHDYILIEGVLNAKNITLTRVQFPVEHTFFKRVVLPVRKKGKILLECRELNPGRQSDSLECYHYTTPDCYFPYILLIFYMKN